MTSALLEKATFAWETIPEALPEGAVSGPSPLHNASESTPPHRLGRTQEATRDQTQELPGFCSQQRGGSSDIKSLGSFPPSAFLV